MRKQCIDRKSKKQVVKRQLKGLRKWLRNTMDQTLSMMGSTLLYLVMVRLMLDIDLHFQLLIKPMTILILNMLMG